MTARRKQQLVAAAALLLALMTGLIESRKPLALSYPENTAVWMSSTMQSQPDVCAW